MYQFKVHIPKEEHDAFVKSHPLCNLLQSSSWAKVKDNWSHEIVGVYDDATLLASASVLIKQLPAKFTMMYIPRGPIMDYENDRLVTFFIQELKKWAKTKKTLFIKMDPSISIRSFGLKEIDTAYEDSYASVLKNLQKVGCVHKGLTTDIDATIQPRFHAYVYNDENFATPSKTLKKALQTVAKKKIEVKEVGKEGIQDFAKVMQCTEKRKNIHLRDEEYFSTLLDIYGDDATIYLAQLPIKELLEETKQRYEQNKKELEECPENAKKKRFTLEELQVSLEREVQELQENYALEGDIATISGALTIAFGNTSELLYAGMNDRYKRYMAPYASFYQSMVWSFDKGCEWCNMGGIEGDLQGGLTKFKSNFTPTIHEFIGEFDLPVNTLLYKASQMAYTLRKKRK